MIYYINNIRYLIK